MSNFHPVSTPKITNLIIDQIREIILSGGLKPKDKLPSERELGERFKASRIAVREALKNLEASGLIVIKPGSGVFVAETNSKTMSDSLYSILRIQNTSLNEISEARLMFEPRVAYLAAERITDKDMQLLEENIKKTESVLNSRMQSTNENIEFHSLVADSVHNTLISLTMRTMLEVARVMTLENSRSIKKRVAISVKSFNMHKLIIEAFRQHDSDKAYQLMRDHIVEVQAALKGAILGKSA